MVSPTPRTRLIPATIHVLIGRRCLTGAAAAGVAPLDGLLKAYEYEEEMYLALDGSARLNVNASVPALVALLLMLPSALALKRKMDWREYGAAPVLGTNPLEFVEAMRQVGPEHCLLSSDAGEPLFPDSVECMRLLRAYAEAFGLSSEQAFQMSTSNPAKLLDLKLN